MGVKFANRIRQPLTAPIMVAPTNINRNPIAIIVPCHRVIGANGQLTGYGGGLDRKLTLLELEKSRAPANLTLFD